MSVKVFVDGKEGTTGLRIQERLAGREDITLLDIKEELRKDPAERKKLINSADIVFLCLPDDAAREAAGMAENPDVRIIDASSAHRTNADWVYGLPELEPGRREKIAAAKRVSVPGCYATGFNLLVNPLIKLGIIGDYYPVICHAVSGYSGAGKKAITQYEDQNRPDGLACPRLYATGLSHKHLPEMKLHCGLAFDPIFNPTVADFYAGMTVTIPLYTRLLKKQMGPEGLREALASYYEGERLIRVMNYGEPQDGFIPANAIAGRDDLEIFVTGRAEQTLLVARLDNLGKGASGAAVQCMNIMLGKDELTGLVVG